MSIKATLFRMAHLLYPLPVVALFLPPLFIFDLTLKDYLAREQISIFLFLVWFVVEAISHLAFSSIGNKTGKGRYRYWTVMLLTSFALVILASSSRYFEEHDIRWFSLGMLALLPTLLLFGTEKNHLFRLFVTLLCYTAFGFLRFCAVTEHLLETSLFLSIAFSLGFASLIAQIPSLRSLEAGHSLPQSKFFLRFTTVMWAIFPAVCISTVGFGLLPNAYVCTVLGFVFIQRLADKLKKYENADELSPYYRRTAIVTLWLEVVLLIGSAELSSYLARVNLS